MSRKKLPPSWRTLPLGSVCDLVIGKTPSRKRDDYWMRGTFPWATIRDMNGPLLNVTRERITKRAVAETGIRLIPRGTVLLSFKLSIGKAAVTGIDLYTNEAIAAVVPKSETVILNEYLYFLLQSLDLIARARQAVKGKTVNKDILLRMPVVVPPPPVQERIVEILQKADEIRRKRQEALDLADKMLPSLFLEMFGDPATNPKGWSKEPIGKLVHFDTAHVKPEPGHTYMYLAPEHIESGTGSYSGPHPTDGRQLGSSKHPFTSEHVLYCMLRPYLNKVVLPKTAGVCSTELVPLRPGPKMLREFLAIYLRLPFFVSAAVQKSQGTKMPRFGPALMKRELMIVPPVHLQRSFCMQVDQLMESHRTLKEAYHLSDASFESLVARAFTGELTAEWEAANAEEIARQTALHERLPRLLVLALLAEKAKRVSRATAEVLVTALMKYVFLLQMEGNGGRRLYSFVPYHYGPFAKELYANLQRLQEQGLVRVDNESDADKVKITLTDPAKAEQALAELPGDLRDDVATIIETYGDLDHNALLKTVYGKYPAYAKKSRLVKKAAKKRRTARPAK